MKLSKTAAVIPVAVGYEGPGSLKIASSHSCTVHDNDMTARVNCAAAFHTKCGTEYCKKTRERTATSIGTRFWDLARTTCEMTPSKRGMIVFLRLGAADVSSSHKFSNSDTRNGFFSVNLPSRPLVVRNSPLHRASMSAFRSCFPSI